MKLLDRLLKPINKLPLFMDIQGAIDIFTDSNSNGTAAVISTAEELNIKGKSEPLIMENKELAPKLFNESQIIQNGYQKDEYGWMDG